MADASPWWAPHVHADRRPCAAGARPHHGGAAGLVRGPRVRGGGDRRRCRSRPATRRICMPSRPSWWRRTDGERRSICAPRRNSPARSCWRRASRGSSSFARVFRNRERGALHHPEFTMLEWYRADEPYGTLMTDCAAMLALRGGGGRNAAASASAAAAATRSPRRNASRWPRRSTRYAGIDLLASVTARRTDRDALGRGRGGGRHPHRRRRHLGRYFQPRAGREASSPNLGLGRATILDEYPAREAALARPPRDPARRRALRALCLRRRARQRLRRTHRPGRAAPPLRARDGREAARLRRALSDRRGFPRRAGHMPPASGIALGFDRLVMLATGAPRIEQVLWAPVAE